MDVRTFRAKTLQEALVLVRRELGPEAAVLQTRHVRRGLLDWLTGRTEVEILASTAVRVPSRFAEAPANPLASTQTPHSTVAATPHPSAAAPRPSDRVSTAAAGEEDLHQRLDKLQQMVEKLYQTPDRPRRPCMPDALFQLYTDLLDAEVPEELARDFVERVRTTLSPDDMDDPLLLKARLARLVEEEIHTSGPIRVMGDRRRVVALVGPTGVGKTTTIAKLAANFHLRDGCRVGLITVDTYRVAAVEQLRTYADIIDLPMEVVAKPREMSSALERMAGMDLVLMDTAGRSPRDEMKIQELKSMLAEAQADEIHLVLSAVSSVASQRHVLQQFAEIDATAVLLTKLDEAGGLGNLLSLVRACRLPLSYVTYGQNVPDDIQPANPRKLARLVLGMERLP